MIVVQRYNGDFKSPSSKFHSNFSSIKIRVLSNQHVLTCIFDMIHLAAIFNVTSNMFAKELSELQIMPSVQIAREK